MKKTFAVTLITFIAIPIFGQLKFGIKAGLSTTSITMNKAIITGQGNTQYSVEALSDANYGFHAGMFLRLTMLHYIYIQPEVMFATSSYTFKVTNINTQTFNNVPQNLNNLSIPVMIGVKLGPVHINAGPAGSIPITSPEALVKDDQTLKSLYNKMSIGYQAGLGFDLFKRLIIDARYEGSLQKYQAQIQQSVGKVNLDSRPNSFLFSLGLMF